MAKEMSIEDYYLNEDIEKLRTDREKLIRAREENRYRERKSDRRRKAQRKKVKELKKRVAAVSLSAVMAAGLVIGFEAKEVNERYVGTSAIVNGVEDAINSHYYVDLVNGKVYYRNQASVAPYEVPLSQGIDHDLKDITEKGFPYSKAYIYLVDKYGKAGKEYIANKYKVIDRKEKNNVIKEAYHEHSLSKLSDEGRSR